MIPEPRETPSESAFETAPAPARRRLPDRRLVETRHVVHRAPDGRETPLAVSIGYDPAEPARPREVFYDAGYRSGTDLEFAVQDLCVVLSLLLQHGVEAREIGRSLSVSHGPDNTAHHGSLAGTITAELAVPPEWAVSKTGEDNQDEGSPCPARDEESPHDLR